MGQENNLRIVSLAPNVTSILLALGAGRELVGVSRWCKDVAAVGRRPTVGDCWKLDVDELLKLRPTLVIGSKRSPIGGGAYLRLLPYAYTRWAIRHLNEHESFPVCVYIHPWELDPQQPRMGGSLSARARHYFGLRGTESKLRKLVRDIEFCPLASLISQLKHTEAVVPA